MSLESQILQIKAKHKALDEAFQDFLKVLHGSHEVVSLILKEQRETNAKISTMEYRLEQLEQLAKQQDKRSDKMEELLIQIVNALASK